MNDLGQLEDLPADYVQALRDLNLVPLWPALRALLPPRVPARQTRPVHWPYQSLRPLLLQAGALTPIEKAERRVLVLANPGHGLDKMQASSAIYLGMQLLLPGEWAPSHRHTPNAVRMIVEGEGAYTTVDGLKCPMHRGDLILTPTGLWHEHGHEGENPVIWLDVLDLPLMVQLEVSYHLNGRRPSETPGQDEAERHGGLLPTRIMAQGPRPYPLLRYPWAEARSGLLALAQGQGAPETVQLSYVNPETGAPAENVLGFHALMLRPGQRLTLPARSPAQVFHVIEGAIEVQVQGQTLSLVEADTCCAPGYEKVVLHNRQSGQPSFVFIADETPLHQKLGVYEVRSRPDEPAMP